MSVVDIVATIVAAGGANLSFLRILRMLRVLRMLRLMKSWKGLYKICMTFLKSIPQMANLFVLMALVMTIFALLGMQLFGGCFNPATGYWTQLTQHEDDAALEVQPRFHFDYFFPAMLTVFNLMTGAFYEPMTEHMQAAGWGISSCFFISAVRLHPRQPRLQPRAQEYATPCTRGCSPVCCKPGGSPVCPSL